MNVRSFKPLVLGIFILFLLPLFGAAQSSNPVLARTFRIVPDGSSVGFVMRATLHKVKGKTGSVEGRVSLSPGESSVKMDGTIGIDASSLDTGNGRRDRSMRKNHLEVESHPTILFRPTGLAGPVQDLFHQKTATLQVRGDLTLHGVTKKLEIPVHANMDQGRILIEGSFLVELKDYNIKNPSRFLLRVKDRIRVWFNLEFTEDKGL